MNYVGGMVNYVGVSEGRRFEDLRFSALQDAAPVWPFKKEKGSGLLFTANVQLPNALFT